MDYEEEIKKHCNTLNLPDNVISESLAILNIIKPKIPREEKHYKRLMGVVGGIIFIAGVFTGHRRTQKEIASVCKVSSLYLRKGYFWVADQMELKFVL